MADTRWDFTRPWFHGSPLVFDVLRAGSTITQDEELARAFSHKPQILSIEDDPVLLANGTPRIRHNGVLPGILYCIAESLTEADIYLHPETSMSPGLEWLTRRPLRLLLLEHVPLNPQEYLSQKDIDDLLRRR